MFEDDFEVPSNPTGTSFGASIWLWIRARLVTGIRVMAPFLITYVAIQVLYSFSSGLFQPVFRDWFGHSFPGLGFAILIGVPFVIGIVSLHFLGNRAVIAIEAIISKIPLVGPTFVVSRQLVSSFGGGAETGFRRVVEIEYPRSRIWSLGFLTDTVEHEDGAQLGVVYVPTTPTPNSGFTVLLPMEDIRDTNLTTNDILRMVLSAGVSSPGRIERRSIREVDGQAPRISDNRGVVH